MHGRPKTSVVLKGRGTSEGWVLASAGGAGAGASAGVAAACRQVSRQAGLQAGQVWSGDSTIHHAPIHSAHPSNASVSVSRQVDEDRACY